MEKIPTALIRDPDNRAKVLPEITPGCEWVFAGEGVPTRKWDGTCVMLDTDDKWWARREVKVGQKTPPNFVAITEQDQVTGKIQGWIPIEDSPFAKYHAEALEYEDRLGDVGTYELVGPKINQNETDWARQKFERHYLVEHQTAEVIPDINRMVLSPKTVMHIIRKIGNYPGWEGVVWHHPDGRMAKLKARDL